MPILVEKVDVSDLVTGTQKQRARRLSRIKRELTAEYRRVLGVPGRGTPSKPGQPPRRQTGNLRSGVRITTNQKTKEASVRLLNGANYGAFLDAGTGTIAPRPWVQRGIKALREKLAKKNG